MGLADGPIPLVPEGMGQPAPFGPVLEEMGLMNGTTIAPFAAATFGLALRQLHRRPDRRAVGAPLLTDLP